MGDNKKVFYYDKDLGIPYDSIYQLAEDLEITARSLRTEITKNGGSIEETIKQIIQQQHQEMMLNKKNHPSKYCFDEKIFSRKDLIEYLGITELMLKRAENKYEGNLIELQKWMKAKQNKRTER